MALALARSLVEADEYDADRVADAYARWYESAPFDMGSTTTQALSKASAARKAGTGTAVAAHRAANRESQANGALMRVSPLGVYGAGFRGCDVLLRPN